MLATGCNPPAHSKSVLNPPPLEVRAPRVPATSFPASLLGAESRRRPSHSKSTVAGSNPFRALATRNTRRRRWANPKYWASKVRQAIALWGPYTQPAFGHLPPGETSSTSSPARPARKHPNALVLSLRTPGTFSQTMMQGGFPALARTWSIASASSIKRRVNWPRSSFKPARMPATLYAWHGVPPTSTSGASISPDSTRAASLVISP